jgi:hypothetical protein
MGVEMCCVLNICPLSKLCMLGEGLFCTLRMYKFPAKKRIRRSGKFKELSISVTTALPSPEGSTVSWRFGKPYTVYVCSIFFPEKHVHYYTKRAIAK